MFSWLGGRNTRRRLDVRGQMIGRCSPVRHLIYLYMLRFIICLARRVMSSSVPTRTRHRAPFMHRLAEYSQARRRRGGRRGRRGRTTVQSRVYISPALNRGDARQDPVTLIRGEEERVMKQICRTCSKGAIEQIGALSLEK